MNTYPGHWAAISGGVEGAVPLEQALREIEEETGLPRGEVELVSEGRPVRFADWELGTVWVVHPLLFRCKAPEQARPDWEHLEFAWLDPSRICELRTVPRLAEAYASAVASEGRPDSRRVFEKVRQDHEHGSEELGLWTLDGLRRAAEEAHTAGADEAFPAMRAACREAAELRPSMAPVRSAALSVFGICRSVCTGGGTLQAAAEEIGRLSARREEESLGPASVSVPFIPDGARIVTLSCSFTVLSVLRESAGRIGALTVAESRPRCEGRQTARLAASFGIRTELVSDAAAASAVQAADLVLFGADALCADGAVVNKMGTFALCCAARCCGVATLCVASESKALPAGLKPLMEEMGPGELSEAAPGVAIRNVYFEIVPAELVERIVTASGVLGADELRRRAEGLRELQQALGGGA